MWSRCRPGPERLERKRAGYWSRETIEERLETGRRRIRLRPLFVPDRRRTAGSPCSTARGGRRLPRLASLRLAAFGGSFFLIGDGSQRQDDPWFRKDAAV